MSVFNKLLSFDFKTFIIALPLWFFHLSGLAKIPGWRLMSLMPAG